MDSSSNDPLKFFVPYVNEKMAADFFIKNPKLVGANVQLVDNRKRSAGLPIIYNEIIDEHIEEDVWLFFVHEDFEVLGDLFNTKKLAKEGVYGTYGVKLNGHTPIGVGLHRCSEKDGSGALNVGIPVTEPTWVETLDCVALLLHTSLLRKRPGLRFDEQLTFDLYAEDICINAQENYGVPVLVLPLEFQHYSKGNVTDRYWRGIKHLDKKYPDVGVPGTCSFIGGRAAELEAHFTYDIPANPKEGRDVTIRHYQG